METEKLNNGFAKVPNHIILDTNISLKARGLLAYMLSRPPGWKFFVNEIMKQSTKDGRTAIQTALRELSDRGYVRLVTVRNKSTNRLEGTRYEINEDACQVFRVSKPPTTGISDRQENKPLNNTEENNTEELDNNKQQQDSVADVEDFNFFFKKLLQDKKWQNHFYTDIPSQNITPEDQFDLLLFYFRGQSLKKSERYKTLIEAKQHFSNWFNQQRDKDNLLKCLNIEKERQKKYLKKVDCWSQKFDLIYDTCKKQTFQATPLVEKAYAEIIGIHKDLQGIVHLVQNPELVLSIERLETDCMTLNKKMENAKSQDQLDWFCQKAQLRTKI